MKAKIGRDPVVQEFHSWDKYLRVCASVFVDAFAVGNRGGNVEHFIFRRGKGPRSHVENYKQ